MSSPAADAGVARPEVLRALVHPWRRLVRPGAPARLVVMERGFVAVLAVRVATSPVRDLADQPAVAFRPPGFLWFLEAMPTAGQVTVLQCVGVAAAVAALVRSSSPRRIWVLVWLVALVLAGLRSSMGKVLHNDVLLLCATFPLVTAALGRPSRHPDPRSAGWPPRLALLTTAAIYTVSGYQKLHWSGIRWAVSDNMQWILFEAAAGSRAPWPWLTASVGRAGVVPVLLASGALVLELTFLLALLGPRLRTAYLVGAASLHVSIWVLIGLDYWMWVATDVVLLVAFHRAGARRWSTAREERC